MLHARKAKLKNHLVSAKARIKQHVTPRRVLLLAAAACSSFLLLVTLRTLHSAARTPAGGTSTGSATPASVHVHNDSEKLRSECAKNVVPAAVAAALVHYATTSSETPGVGQTQAEVASAPGALARRAPCNLLVFGLGADAPLWTALNHGGRTLFLDADAARVASASSPAGLDLDAHYIAYQDRATAVSDELLALRDSPDCSSPTTKPLSPDDLGLSPCTLAPRGLPAAFYEAEWDVIVANAPPAAGAIYAAGVVARARSPRAGETDVVVHGVDSPAEERFARAFLCEGYIREEAGRTRRFAIPSRRDKEAMPFCP
jgi:glucuronoxylan 4-O-methyltransferase